MRYFTQLVFLAAVFAFVLLAPAVHSADTFWAGLGVAVTAPSAPQKPAFVGLDSERLALPATPLYDSGHSAAVDSGGSIEETEA